MKSTNLNLPLAFHNLQGHELHTQTGEKQPTNLVGDEVLRRAVRERVPGEDARRPVDREDVGVAAGGGGDGARALREHVDALLVVQYDQAAEEAVGRVVQQEGLLDAVAEPRQAAQQLAVYRVEREHYAVAGFLEKKKAARVVFNAV